MGRKDPIVTVGDTAPGQVAVITLIAKPTEELRAMQMHAEIMALELLAQPIFHLRLGEPETHLLIVLESPGIVSAHQLDSHLLARGELQPNVRRRRQPIETVCLQREILGFTPSHDSDPQQHEKTNLPAHDHHLFFLSAFRTLKPSVYRFIPTFFVYIILYVQPKLISLSFSGAKVESPRGSRLTLFPDFVTIKASIL